MCRCDRLHIKVGKSWVSVPWGWSELSTSNVFQSDGVAVVRPIMAADIDDVAQFLHDEMNRRIPAATWAAAMQPSWPVDGPNHGFMLVAAGRLAGVQLAFYSQRPIEGKLERFCNIAAWCVLPQYRAHGVRLLRAILMQRNYTFTDLSPSGNVIPMNRLLKFQNFDTEASLAINLPWPATKSVRVISDREAIEAAISGNERTLYRDHARACAAHHLLIVSGNRSCYVIFRRDRRKRLPLFGSILYVSDREVFRRTSRHLLSCLLMQFGIAATILERRVVGCRPGVSFKLRSPRAKMYLSNGPQADEIDYLYSELVSVPW